MVSLKQEAEERQLLVQEHDMRASSKESSKSLWVTQERLKEQELSLLNDEKQIASGEARDGSGIGEE